jgi:CDP-2,3-bis-(O-geranylgeranyl)-sn-glycerol synthase
MGSTVIQALFFFLPAYAANAAPVIFARYGWWKRMAVPVDMGVRMGKTEMFGRTKTWRGILAGVAAGVLVAVIQYLVHEIAPWREYIYLFRYTFLQSVFLGLLMGLGEGAGDLVKSYIKRRLNLKSGDPAFPLDQSSFLGALLLSFLVYTPPSGHILAIVIISPFIPVMANVIAYKTGLKKVWW